MTRAQALAMLGFAHTQNNAAAAAVDCLRAAIEPIRLFRPGHAWFTLLLADAYLLQHNTAVARSLFETGCS